MSNPYSSIDELLAKARAVAALPPPAERKRLRKVAGLTQAEGGAAAGVSRESFGKWEAGIVEPRGAKRAAYRYLLAGLAEIHGTQGDTSWLPAANEARPDAATDTSSKGE